MKDHPTQKTGFTFDAMQQRGAMVTVLEHIPGGLLCNVTAGLSLFASHNDNIREQ